MNHADTCEPLQITAAAGRVPTAARSRCYQLFSAAFSYPWEEAASGLLSGDWQDALRSAAEQLPYPVPPSIGTDMDIAFSLKCAEDLQTLYSGLFDGVAGKQSISLYEKDYAHEARAKLWEDLLRFYKYFGLDFADSKAKEAPDQLSMQLDFLHYLTFLEAGASASTESFIAAELDFLERHLGRWIPRFAEKLRKAESSGPYERLATLLDDFVAADVRHLRDRIESAKGPAIHEAPNTMRTAR